MRVTIFLPLICAFSSVFAAPVGNIAARDTKLVLASITSITKSLQDMTAAINGLSKNPNSNDVVRQLKTKANSVRDEMKFGAASISAGPNIDLWESTGLILPLASLNSATDTSLNAWISAKAHIVKTGGREQVLDILREHGLAADKFADAVLSKLPELAKYIGKEYGDQISKRIRNAVEQFRV